MATDRPRLDARAAELKEKVINSRKTGTPNNPTAAVESEGESSDDLIRSVMDESLPGPAVTGGKQPKAFIKREEPSPLEKAAPLFTKQVAPTSGPKAYRDAEKALSTPTKRPVVPDIPGAASLTMHLHQERALHLQRRALLIASGPVTGNLDQKQSAGDALTRLLKQDSDLRQWLTMTNYHDVESRNRKLERYRKIKRIEAEKNRIEAENKRIEAEKKRIEAEHRRLMEEAELDRIVPTSLSPPTNSLPLIAPPEHTNGSRSDSRSAKR
ncbi:hypothetical protein QBC34DRAFT_473706 [Podospora aff. communis PSN243]|uniref:Uncharacterized protein n=1 Tax=Podospora aff. communis PSN243 TaxID=3040156 RepID=A0AAV9H206_9PEZI|nr:hypothetical protein QBC34DRAFT_473706 [Podospora aff. communis PSN243]